jgi:hypothetical protein
VKTVAVTAEVASLVGAGKRVRLTFKKATGTSRDQVGCRRTNRVLRVDGDGTVVYEEVRCRWVTNTYDKTEPEVVLPADEAAAVGVGYTVMMRVDSQTPRRGFLVWAKNKRGDVVWAGGFTPASSRASTATP